MVPVVLEQHGRTAPGAQALFQRLLHHRTQTLVRQGTAAYSAAKRQASSELWAPLVLHPAQSSMAVLGRMPTCSNSGQATKHLHSSQTGCGRDTPGGQAYLGHHHHQHPILRGYPRGQALLGQADLLRGVFLWGQAPPWADVLPRGDIGMMAARGRLVPGLTSRMLWGCACSDPTKKAQTLFLQGDEGHEKATKKPRKSHEKVTSKNVTSNEKSPRGISLVKNTLPADSEEVLGNFAIYMAYAMVSSGHLPLMMPMLLLSFLAEGSVWPPIPIESRGVKVHPPPQAYMREKGIHLSFLCFSVF